MPAQEEKSLLRFLTCGSVDDGKSTLIGRLLYDTKLIFEDQLAALERDSLKHGTNGADIDFALLVDGLEAEREQGITIDVAYRFFATPKRKFIVADTPGHEQYTRNMATGASTADLAVVLVDARQGILRQTRRHSIIASLLGIRHIALAVNKFDLVGFDRARFRADRRRVSGFCVRSRLCDDRADPDVGALWRQRHPAVERNAVVFGPTLLDHLENVSIDDAAADTAVPLPHSVREPAQPRFPRLCRDRSVRLGRKGDAVVVAKSGKLSRVKRIVTAGWRPVACGRRPGGHACAGGRDRGVARRHARRRPTRGRRWPTSLRPTSSGSTRSRCCLAGPIFCRTETDQASATVSELKHRINVNDFAHEAAKTLEMNEVGVVQLSLAVADCFRHVRAKTA